MNTYTSRTGHQFPHTVEGPTGQTCALTGTFGFFGFPGADRNDYRVVALYKDEAGISLWQDDQGQSPGGSSAVVHDQWVENI